MSKPDDIAQWAWDKARDVAFDFDCDWTHGDRLEADAIVAIARAIMAAKEEAYEDAAKIAEDYRHGNNGFRADEPDKTVYGWGAARRSIAASIRSKANRRST